MKYFNTAGPCIPEMHYMLPPEQRLPEAQRLVERGHYFGIHAPRQTGKTTLLHALSRSLTATGKFAALHFTCETAEPVGDDYGAAQRAILTEMRMAADLFLPVDLRPPEPWPAADDLSLLRMAIAAWAQRCPRPLVLFFDEIDAVRGDSLRAVLRQLRAGFPVRVSGFAWSVALCGLRDVRDYKAASGGDPTRLGTVSPFNIKVASLRLGNFDERELRLLYGQHTEATGQAFAEDALTRAFELTGGQPWLCNALADKVTDELGVPSGEPITRDHVEQARERLIVERATHLDSLVARLMEPRVRRLVEPLIAGEAIGGDTYDDDAQYLRALGLAAPDDPLRVSNPIYREIIVRVLALSASGNITVEPRRFVRLDGGLDMDMLLREFAAFWCEQGEAILPKMPYHEVAAQLVLLAWLQRVVNGGGSVDREYGAGTKRIDVLVTWPLRDSAGRRAVQREVLELKVWRDGEADPTPAGLRQIEGYLERTGVDHGHLIVFDRRSTARPITERVAFSESSTPERGLPVTLLMA